MNHEDQWDRQHTHKLDEPISQESALSSFSERIATSIQHYENPVCIWPLDLLDFSMNITFCSLNVMEYEDWFRKFSLPPLILLLQLICVKRYCRLHFFIFIFSTFSHILFNLSISWLVINFHSCYMIYMIKTISTNFPQLSLTEDYPQYRMRSFDSIFPSLIACLP